MPKRPPTATELQSSPHRAAHERTAAFVNDRVANRPRDLRGLLRWAWATYKQEPPARLHETRLMGEDGDPKMAAEAIRWIGFDGKDGEPDDWRRVACRIVDGCYLSPMRCAIETTPDMVERMFLRALVVNVLTPEGICEMFKIPDWCYDDAAFGALNRLYTRFMDRPLPKRSKPKSDAQLNAEAEYVA